MSASDWTAVVGSTEEVTDAYATPPDLDACRLYYVQIDEREASVTLMFETTALPERPPPAWADRAYDTVEFYLTFTGVRGLRVSGWEFSARDAGVALNTGEGTDVRVTVEAEGSYLDFTASGSSLARFRSYLSAGPCGD
ncbi:MULTISPECIES: Imm50 family immunity protein [unclassified Streptomyces]|uniref:Imm50 family immunity protein n=1 Tax=unclassified Streptomyces TaxID=2593676 RepID=UPI0006AF3B5E|nr:MULTISPECIES: Imm50 family immunity protein [unclassified Streptomyces]